MRHRRTLLALFVMVLLTPVGWPASVAQATAIPNASGAEQVPQPQVAAAETVVGDGGCEALQQRLPELAAQGVERGSCVEPAAPHPELLPTSPGTEAIPAPSWCATSGTYYYITRTQSCGIFGGVVTIKEVRTGTVVGTISFNVVDYSYTSVDDNSWAHQLQVDAYEITGEGAGSSVSGSFGCSGACRLTSQSFPSQLVTLSSLSSGDSFYDTTITAAGAVGSANTTVSYSFSNPSWGVTNSASRTQVRVRCDNAVAAKAIGCVIPAYISVVAYSRSGPYSEVARHIGDAQASGLPGSYPSGTPLTHLTDPTLQRRNNSTACPNPRYPRPPGKQCDEYPFRSSYQGAYTGGGTARTFSYCSITLGAPPSTGSRGWSICMVTATQNMGAGGVLGNFYNSYRVLAHDPFQVWITA